MNRICPQVLGETFDNLASRCVIDVTDPQFGAVPDGRMANGTGTDNSDALQAAADYAATLRETDRFFTETNVPTIFLPRRTGGGTNLGSGYVIKKPIVFPDGVEVITCAPIIVAEDDVAPNGWVRLGGLDPLERFQGTFRACHDVDVVRSRQHGSDWSDDADIGVWFQNQNVAWARLRRIDGFTIGIRQDSPEMHMELGYVANCRIGLDIWNGYPDGDEEGTFSNASHYHGGEFLNNGGGVASAGSTRDRHAIRIYASRSGVNALGFSHQSYELGSNSNQYDSTPIEVVAPEGKAITALNFYHQRTEGSQTAGGAIIRTTGNCSAIRVKMNYTQPALRHIDTNDQSSNVVVERHSHENPKSLFDSGNLSDRLYLHAANEVAFQGMENASNAGPQPTAPTFRYGAINNPSVINDDGTVDIPVNVWYGVRVACCEGELDDFLVSVQADSSSQIIAIPFDTYDKAPVNTLSGTGHVRQEYPQAIPFQPLNWGGRYVLTNPTIPSPQTCWQTVLTAGQQVRAMFIGVGGGDRIRSFSINSFGGSKASYTFYSDIWNQGERLVDAEPTWITPDSGLRVYNTAPLPVGWVADGSQWQPF